MKKNRFIFTLFLIVAFSICYGQSPASSSARIKSIYIYNFSKYFEWPKVPDSREFRIGVLGDDADLVGALEKMAVTKLVNGLPFKVLKFAKISDITQTEMLIVDYHKNPELKIEKINKATLVITENDPDLNNIMLAFVTSEDNKIRFALNEINISKVNLILSDNLKTLAVSFKLSAKDRSNNEKVLKEYKSVFDKFSEAIKNNSSEIKLSKEEAAEVLAVMDANKTSISEKEEKLKSQQINLQQQKAKIDEQLNSILTQEQKLKLQEEKLKLTIAENLVQEEDLEISKEEVEQQKRKMLAQKDILLEQKKDIDSQSKKLISQLGQINSQKAILYLAGFLVLIIAVAFFIAYRGNKNKQKANALLSKQKIEIENQRELVEEKQKEILDSINYAKRIQYSLLASDKLLISNLPNHFLFFKPKDVVSGDFYWVQN